MTKSEKPMYEEGKELAHLLRDVLQLRIRTERLARNLDRLYDFAYRKLLEGSLRGDQAAVLAAVEVIAPLRDSWRTACVGAPVPVS